ncbi:hypothetical protein CXF83_04985 [Shewanella sp. Choline-02u-19]|uniref:hypothetical protein n=1 Tax=unclassified Shewanella TaxID=196818 RepID=UPI000C33FA17|nr:MULTISPECIES: hypothetical protein [unclassified Shewanella]PKH56446.1 hypothetical protein CXF84_13490 [Shewanella sp. Bg11-22]PKI29999.1 hypothetical protein CXF83_04985 [Shewanella sp. Choline-02u-19]
MVKTTLTISTPYAYYKDDSLLIVNLNHIHCQMRGQSSASTFVSSEGCDPEQDKNMGQELH